MTAVRHRNAARDDREARRADRDLARRGGLSAGLTPQRSSRRRRARGRRRSTAASPGAPRARAWARATVKAGYIEPPTATTGSSALGRGDREESVGEHVEDADHDQHRPGGPDAIEPRASDQQGRRATVATPPTLTARIAHPGRSAAAASRPVKKIPNPRPATIARTIERRAVLARLDFARGAPRSSGRPPRRSPGPARRAGSRRATRPRRARRRPAPPPRAPRSARRR